MNKGNLCEYHSWFTTSIIKLHIKHNSGPLSIKNISHKLKINNSADWAILQRSDEYDRNLKIKKLIENYEIAKRKKANLVYKNQEFFKYIYIQIYSQSVGIRPKILRRILTSRATHKDLSEILVMYENMKRLNDLCPLSKKPINQMSIRKNKLKLSYKDYPIAFEFNGKYGFLDGSHRRSILRYLGFKKSKHLVFNMNLYKYKDYKKLYCKNDYEKLKKSFDFYIKTLENIIVT